MEAGTARLLARVCLVRSVHVCKVFFCKGSFCRLAAAGFSPWCFYFGAQELELSAAAGIQGHRFLLPVGLRAMADAVVDLEEVSSESSEYTVDPPVAAEGGPDVRYCPKCKTVSFIRKGACSNRKCDSWLFSGVSFFVFFCTFFFKQLRSSIMCSSPSSGAEPVPTEPGPSEPGPSETRPSSGAEPVQPEPNTEPKAVGKRRVSKKGPAKEWEVNGQHQASSPRSKKEFAAATGFACCWCR